MAKKRILVIEDESDLVQALEIRLRYAGYDLLIASDGEEGLDKVRQEKPDLIILDLVLPKMNGYKVCSLLKGDTRYSKIPIIMLTAMAQEFDRKMGEGVGAQAYITKPFDHQVLLGTIKELLKDQ